MIVERSPEDNGEYLLDGIHRIGIGKRDYDLTLEVTLPGREPYEVSGRFKVPAKAETTGPMSRRDLVPGLELPVRADPDEHTRVEVDWDAFLSSPGRKSELKAAAETHGQARGREMYDANPELRDQLRAGNRAALPTWIEAVRGGQMNRSELEQTIDLELKFGRMDQADADAALKKLSEL